ncbi:MAG: GNAT family N-acetyltransferase [Candidatus Aenigmatarchaeota archaeon]
MIEIREATPEDIELIIELWNEFQDYQKDLLKKDPTLKSYLEKKKDAKQIFRNYITGRVESPEAKVMIAYADGKPAGYCLYMIEKTIPIFKMEKIGYISDLFVRPSFRGQGISSMFRDKAYEWFRKIGLTHVSIKLYPGNIHAHSIYAKWGFRDYHIEMRRKL